MQMHKITLRERMLVLRWVFHLTAALSAGPLMPCHQCLIKTLMPLFAGSRLPFCSATKW